MALILTKKFESFLRTSVRTRFPILFRLLKRAYYAYRRGTGSHRLRRNLRARPLRLALGAGGIFDHGWIPTEIYELNIAKESDWRRFFKPGTVDAMLAEHVWEHMTPADAVLATENCYRYLRPGGYLRIAVPDGYNPAPGYTDLVGVGGTGPSADDHKALYTYKTLMNLVESAGFKVRLLEYHDESGRFHNSDWSEAEGTIHRSSRRRTSDARFKNPSIVLDALR
jgi:predicted SAM-dependent methyltransferase